jgi:DNA-directed RNA polymerase subunit H
MENRLNVLEHELVPQHVILSKKEAEEVLKKYKIKPEQLPKIFTTDPGAITIGAKPGQIIKIIRKSRTAKQAVAYRLTIESDQFGLKIKSSRG